MKQSKSNFSMAAASLKGLGRGKVIENLKKGILFLILLAIAFTAIYPMYFMIITAFKTTKDYMLHKFAFPSVFVSENLYYAWVKVGLQRYFSNTLLVVGVGVIIYLIVCSMAAYAFAKMRFRFRLGIFLTVLGLMVLPQVVLVVPLYKLVISLGLLNNRIGLSLVYVAYFAPFGVYLMTAYYRGVPDEIIEAARLDGASVWQTYIWIMLPMGKPTIATMTVIGFLSMWNELLYALLFLQKSTKRTLMLGIALMQGQYGAEVPRLAAGLLITCIPVVVIFLIFQRYITKGLTAGAIKE